MLKAIFYSAKIQSLSTDRVAVWRSWQRRFTGQQSQQKPVCLRHSIHCVSKKVPTFELSVTLSNLNDFQNFCIAGKHTKFALKNPYDTTHLTICVLLHYLGKLNSQILVYIYAANMDENANKQHFQITAFNSSMRVNVYAECICVSRIFKILSIQRHRYILW